MRIKIPYATETAGLIAAKTVHTWMSTLDYRALFYDPHIDPVRREFEGPKIFIFWHEYILFPLYLRGHCNLAMLLSQHRDADILARVADHLGFDTVRGSTNRGSAAAVREMLRRCRHMNLAITPDGPRGPRRKLAQGAIYLASKLGLPIVAMGFGYDRPWRMRSWDRFALPRPWSRARGICSPQIHLPADLDRDGIEYYRQRVERLLTHLSDEAEAWATSGERRAGEVIVRQQTAPLKSRQYQPAHDEPKPTLFRNAA